MCLDAAFDALFSAPSMETPYGDWIRIHELRAERVYPGMRDCARSIHLPRCLGTRTEILRQLYPTAIHPYEWPR